MKSVIFFKKKKNVSFSSLFPNLKIKKNLIINNIRTLNKSTKNDLTFFNSIKYKSDALSTKASFCITTKKLENFLPQFTKKIYDKSQF